MKVKRVAVFGGNGAIGQAFVQQLSERTDCEEITVYSRTAADVAGTKVTSYALDYLDEDALASHAQQLAVNGPLDLILVTTGILHQDDIRPEKAMKEITQQKLATLFQVNTVIPALIAKHFLPLLPKDEQAVFAALSARVGSVSDNRLGGWHSYRASKAALNMIIKGAAIEHHRRAPHSIIVGLHPGTVDSTLSKPFQRSVKPEKLFTPQFSAKSLLDVLERLSPSDSGKCFDWQGLEVLP